MIREAELMNAVKAYRDNLKLEAEIERISDQMEENDQLIIRHFFPYILSIYEKWHPKLEEKAICIDLEKQHCFEVTIKEINGDTLRARVGKQDIYYRLNLKPKLEEYEKTNFILPMWSYDEVKHLFNLRLIW
jgi:hypothetical protein